MPATTFEPSARRSLDAALAGLDALATALEQAAAARPVGSGRASRPQAAPPVTEPARRGGCARPRRYRPVHREVARIAVNVVGALVLVTAVLAVAGWALMTVLPAPPRPAVATVESLGTIHPPGVPAP